MAGRRALAAVMVAAAALPYGTATAARAPAKARDLLPVLYVLQSPDLHVGSWTDAPQPVTTSNPPEFLYGCDPYESVEKAARLCLRFDTLVVNGGSGALELRYDGHGAVGAMRAQQRIYRTDGTSWQRQAGMFYFDPAHQHFHYSGFELATLWRSDSRGHRLGKPVASTGKDGFCLEDLNPYSTSAGTAHYKYPAACYPTEQPDGSLTQVNGISPGYMDIYDETLTDQYLEISTLPTDGYFLLEIVVDPGHTLLLDPRSRTTAWELIHVCGRSVDIVGRTQNCAARHGVALVPVRADRWRLLCASGWCPAVPVTGRAGFGSAATLP